MILTNEFEPVFSDFGDNRVVVTGLEGLGVWYLGPGDRKVGTLAQALRMAPGPAAERLAARFGGTVMLAKDCKDEV